MQAAIDEVTRRRQIQIDYNRQHHITPASITKPIRAKLTHREPKPEPVPIDIDSLTPQDKKPLIRQLTHQMNQAAAELNFELAASLLDTIKKLT